MTVLLRDKSAEPADAISPVARAIAAIAARMHGDGPVFANKIEFEAAEKEMSALYEARGYSTIQRADLPQRNFLLFGVPVICSDA